MTKRKLLWALLWLCAVAPARLLAQDVSEPVRIDEIQPLAFGALTPGVSSRVTLDDRARRAEFLVEGTGAVEVALVLPGVLEASRGSDLPLRFGPADAAVIDPDDPQAPPIYFDPAGSVTLVFGDRPARRIVILGGTALVPADQSAGSLHAPIQLIAVPRISP